jgi:hypothetical protein
MQYMIVNALAELELAAERCGTVTQMMSGKDLSNQQIPLRAGMPA